MHTSRRTVIKNMLLLLPGLKMPFLVSGAMPFPAESDTGDAGTTSTPGTTGRFRIYTKLINARQYPDDNRRHVQPPNWETFGNRTHFMTLRSFQVKDKKLVHFREDIEHYAVTLDLGDVIWPHNEILFTENLPDFVAEIKKRAMFLFDIWGYVPGSGNGFWRQFKLTKETSALFEKELGDHWLGMDCGEQDGRYIARYAGQMYPIPEKDRVSQYLNFQRHFEKLTGDLGDRMSTLVSLNFGHYLLKEGLYMSIGAETAQGLPNSQVYYSFIRGAGKQYGVPWFGNASLYNRWGYKNFDAIGGEGNELYGPTKGTSLSLLRRLLYSHILYNSMMAGFEMNYIHANDSVLARDRAGQLTPAGRIQVAANKWVKAHGQPGTHLTPVAILLDFFSGWTFPRHLYSQNVYRVWGNLPYEAGDYFTDAVIDMLYPGYQDASFYHDEKGFLTPSPYGDMTDCLLTDAEQWLMDRYAVLVVAGGHNGGQELKNKLDLYLKNGGHLIIKAGNLSGLPGGLAGIHPEPGIIQAREGQQILSGSTEPITETAAFDYHLLKYPAAATIVSTVDGHPAVLEMTHGKGRITVLAAASGIGLTKEQPFPDSRELVDKPLYKPYYFLRHVRQVLDAAFREQMLFEVDKDLHLVTCRKEQGVYTLGVSNNTWETLPLNIVSHCGAIAAIKELALQPPETNAAGYLPEIMQDKKMQASKGFIAGGDIRIFSVRVKEENVGLIDDHIPPPRARGRILSLYNISSVKEEILKRPTFFEHFDGVRIDWKYLHNKDAAALRLEEKWIAQQKLHIVADLSSGLNLYPDLRLIDNVEEDFAASIAAIEDVIDKSAILHIRDIVLTLNMIPENNLTTEDAFTMFRGTVSKLCEKAGGKGIALHLRLSRPRRAAEQLKDAVTFIKGVDAPNLFLAPDTGHFLTGDPGLSDMTPFLKERVKFWMLNAYRSDGTGRSWDVVLPFARYPEKGQIARILALAPQAAIVFNAAYKDTEEEYLDAVTLKQLLQ